MNLILCGTFSSIRFWIKRSGLFPLRISIHYSKTIGTKVYEPVRPPILLPMVFAEDIRKIILKIADECGPEKAFAPSDVAQRVDRENWQSLMDQVRFVASI